MSNHKGLSDILKRRSSLLFLLVVPVNWFSKSFFNYSVLFCSLPFRSSLIVSHFHFALTRLGESMFWSTVDEYRFFKIFIIHRYGCLVSENTNIESIRHLLKVVHMILELVHFIFCFNRNTCVEESKYPVENTEKWDIILYCYVFFLPPTDNVFVLLIFIALKVSDKHTNFGSEISCIQDW